MIDQIVAWLLGSRAWRSLLFFVVGYAIVVVVTLLILVVVIATVRGFRNTTV